MNGTASTALITVVSTRLAPGSRTAPHAVAPSPSGLDTPIAQNVATNLSSRVHCNDGTDRIGSDIPEGTADNVCCGRKVNLGCDCIASPSEPREDVCTKIRLDILTAGHHGIADDSEADEDQDEGWRDAPDIVAELGNLVVSHGCSPRLTTPYAAIEKTREMTPAADSWE